MTSDQTDVQKPFARRSLYIHMCWDYFRPYCPRQWSDDDWHGFFDACIGIGYNHFMIWPLIEAYLPDHHRQDRAAFARINSIITQTKRRHPDVEFWGTMTANCITDPVFNEPIYERDCFAHMHPIDPREPANLETLHRLRSAAMEVMPHFDGWAVIDGDPGGWPDLPVGDFLPLMKMVRELITQTQHKGKEAQLVYWMWTGWGDYFDYEEKVRRWRDFIRLLDEHIGPENWHPLAAGMRYSEHAGRLLSGLDRTETATRLWYGAVELEPNPPYTHTDAGILDEVFAEIRQEGPWQGVMVNAQNLVLQLPRLVYAGQLLQGKRPDPNRIIEDAAQAFDMPGLAEAWKILRAARQGEVSDHKEPVQLNTNGSRLFDEHFLSQDALQQSQVILAARRLTEALNARDMESLEERFYHFICLGWERFEHTGYFGGLNGHAYFKIWNYPGMPCYEDLERIRTAWDDMEKQCWGPFAPVLGQIISRVHDRLVDDNIPPMTAAMLIQQLLGHSQPPYYIAEKPDHA